MFLYVSISMFKCDIFGALVLVQESWFSQLGIYINLETCIIVASQIVHCSIIFLVKTIFQLSPKLWTPFGVPFLVRGSHLTIKKFSFLYKRKCEYWHFWYSDSWEKDFLKKCTIFSRFCNYPTFKKVFVKLSPVVLEKMFKMWKVYRQTDGRAAKKKTERTTYNRCKKSSLKVIHP